MTFEEKFLASQEYHQKILKFEFEKLGKSYLEKI